MQRHLPLGWPRYPQGHGRVAFLPFTSITLKGLIPQETDFIPITLGDHVYARRLERKLTQKQAAKLIGVNPFTLLNWEKGHTEAIPMKAIPAITAFLGYDPFPAPASVAEQLKAYRRRTG